MLARVAALERQGEVLVREELSRLFKRVEASVVPYRRDSAPVRVEHLLPPAGQSAGARGIPELKGDRRPEFLSVILSILIVGLFLLTAVTQKIPPASIGVKQVVFGTWQGVVQEDFRTGLVLAIPSYHRWHLLPRQTHFLHFVSGEKLRDNRNTSRGIEDWQQPLELRTKDNNNVTIDVSLTYRIVEGSGYKLVEEGLRLSYVERVRSQVLNVLRTELAKLTSEDLQLTDKRSVQAAKPSPFFDQDIGEFHVEPEDLLIRAVKFLPDYESKLQNKQLLRQESKLEEALTKQAEEDQKVQTQKRQIAAAVLAEVIWEKRIQERRSAFEVNRHDLVRSPALRPQNPI